MQKSVHFRGGQLIDMTTTSDNPHFFPMEEGWLTAPIAKLMNRKIFTIVNQKDPCPKITHNVIDADKMFCCLFCPSINCVTVLLYT